jgi:hypothetical protein
MARKVAGQQRRFMGAELERKREGKKTRTDVTEKELEDFARKPRKEAHAGASPVPQDA